MMAKMPMPKPKMPNMPKPMPKPNMPKPKGM